MESMEDIGTKIINVKKVLEQLDQDMEKARVAEGISINCGDCKRYIEEPSIQEKDTGLCYNCMKKKSKEKQKKRIKSLVGAVVAEVEPTDFGGAIQSMIVIKDGLGFELKPDGDEDSAQIEVFEEGKKEIPLNILGHLRPGDRPRPTNEQKIDRCIQVKK